MADLATLANVKTTLGITSAGDDARINLIIPAVSAWVRTFCGRTFDSATYTDHLDGGDRAKIFLEEPPVGSITSLHVSTAWPRVYGASQLLVLDTDYTLEDGPAGIVARASGRFPEGPRTVKVVYAGGYSAVPTDLERAVIEVVSVKLQKAKTQTYHLAGENRGDGAVSFIDTISQHDVPMHALKVFEAFRLRRAA